LTLLSPGQAKVLDAIEVLTQATGYPPTVRELCHHTGFSSTATMTAHLEALEAAGRITRTRGKPRTVLRRSNV